MRKQFLILLLSVMTMAAFGASDALWVLHESFENTDKTQLPQNWTEEQVRGTQHFGVADASNTPFALTVPDGKQVVAFLNSGNQTTHYVTKLVTPVMDLSKVTEPVLVFRHLQPQRSGDVDELRVYYRTSAESRWVLLEEYTSKIQRWQTDTISLPAKNTTYQIAFEATDNLGYGLYIDNIEVRPYPTCINPVGLEADPERLTSTSARLLWTASLDADSFQVVVATEQLDLNNINTSAIISSDVTADWYYDVKDLENNTSYYFYVKAFCPASETDFSEGTFTTLNLIDLPWSADFNLPYVNSKAGQIAALHHGTSIVGTDGGSAYLPFINQFQNITLESFSFDRSRVYAFAGELSMQTPVPAGQFVYLASPQLNVPNLQNVEVEFWGSASGFVGDDYAAGIIVGVMTNPNAVNTFVPVDTVYLTQPYEFHRFNIYLDSYKGDGKFVTFMSDFKDKKNLFYLDNLTIRTFDVKLPEVVGITGVDVDQLTIEVDAKNNDSYSIVLATDQNFKGEKPQDILVELTDYKTNKVTVKSDKIAGENVQIYVQGKKGDKTSLYQNPVSVKIPEYATLPITFTMNKSDMPLFTREEQNAYVRFLTDWGYPYLLTQPTNDIVNSTSYTTSASGFSGRDIYALLLRYPGNYIAMPAVENAANIRISFEMSPNSSDILAYGEDVITLGVMTDPYDISTFKEVKTFTGDKNSKTVTKVIYSLYNDKKQYDGKYLALKYASTNNLAENLQGVLIDNIVIEDDSKCPYPTNLVVEPKDNGFDLKWDGNGSSQWVAKISEQVSAGYGMNLHYEQSTAVLKTVGSTTNQMTIDALEAHTNYYLELGAVCGTDTLLLDPLLVRTAGCLPSAIPYTENFDKYAYGAALQQLPDCWEVSHYLTYNGGSLNEYNECYAPYISYYGTNSTNGLLFGKVNDAINPVGQYVVLPEMNDSITNLQLRLWIASYNGVTDTLEVGAIDAKGAKQKLGVIPYGSTSWAEKVVRLGQYKGISKGAKIYIQTNGMGCAEIDNITIEKIDPCAWMQNVTLTQPTVNGITISWDADDTNAWEVLFSTVSLSDTTKTLNLSTVTKDSAEVALWNNVTTNPVTIADADKLKENTLYYVYVRSVCGTNNYGDWSKEVSFRTLCAPVAPAIFTEEYFADEASFLCWTIAMRQGTSYYTRYNTTYKAVRLYSTASDDSPYAVMPSLTVDDITKYQVSFDAHGGSSANSVKTITVGVITDPTDLTTFESLGKVDVPQVSTVSASNNYGFNEANRYTVRLNEYEGDFRGNKGTAIMFIVEAGDAAADIYIKNVSVTAIPACQEPIDVKADSVSSNSAHLVWDKTGDKYEVKVATKAIDVETEKGDIFDGEVSTNELTLSDIAMLQTYYVYVRTVCSATEKSAWSNVRTFATECPVAFTLPYSQTFDQFTKATTAPSIDCWTTFYNGNMGGSYPSIYAGDYRGNGFALRFYPYNASRNTVAVLPAIDCDWKTTQLSFYYHADAEGKDTKLQIGITDNVESEEKVLENVVWLDTIATNTSAWSKYEATLDKYEGNGKYIVFAAIYVSSKNGVVIDEVLVEQEPQFKAPFTAEVTSVAAKSVDLKWTQTKGTPDSWEVAYTTEETLPENPTTIAANQTNATVTGLTPDTDYKFYVRAVYGTNRSAWVGPMDVHTACLVDLENAKWNFDDPDARDANPTIEHCWKAGLTNTTAVSSVELAVSYANNGTTIVAASGTSSLKLTTYSTTRVGAHVILPMVDASYDTLQFSFKASYVTVNASTKAISRASGYRSVKVGYVLNADIKTFVMLKEVVLNEVSASTADDDTQLWEEITVPLYGIPADAYLTLLNNYTGTTVYIDDVAIEKVAGCAAPSMLDVNQDDPALQGTGAVLTWKSPAKKWNVKILDSSNAIVDAANDLEVLTYTTTKLQPLTTYTFSVQGNCGDDQLSDWASLTFTTPCQAISSKEDAISFNSADALDCWDILLVNEGTGTVTASTYKPQVKMNTASAIYAHGSHETTNGALQFRTYKSGSTRNSHEYAIMPEVNMDISKLALHFYGRPNSASATAISGSNSNYSNKMEIGVMTDPTDKTSFVLLSTITYDKKLSYDNLSDDADEFWQEYTISLSEFAGKGRIAFHFPTHTSSSYFYIDDISFVDGNFCSEVNAIEVKDITPNTALVTWNVFGSDSVAIELYEDGITTPVQTLNIAPASHQYTLEDLKSFTTYSIRMKHFCDDNQEADWSNLISFYTLAAPRFSENFDADLTLPLHWRHSTEFLESILSGRKQMSYESETYWDIRWLRTGDNTGMGLGTVNLPMNEYTHNWLHTPTIDLRSYTENDHILLTFEAGLYYANSNPVRIDSSAVFMVIISEDNGQTWTRQNATTWGMQEDADYQLSTLRAERQLIKIDLSKYAGKEIVISFFGGSQVNYGNTLYLDNVQVNTYELQEYAASVCRWNDYDDDHFSLDEKDLRVGTTTYEQVDLATADGFNDKIYRLNLTVNDAATTQLEAAICEGGAYNDNGFNLTDVSTGLFKQKLTSASGCDSIVELNLTVRPVIQLDVVESICPGSYFEFGDQRYYTATNTTFTFTSSLGCDSVVTLHLTMTDSIRGETEVVYLCEGETFNFTNNFPAIAEEGFYRDILTTNTGCDSIASVNVISVYPAHTVTRAAICQGEKYSQGIWQGLSASGVYETNKGVLHTIYGCDSISALHLMVATDGVINDQISVDELPYILNGEELFGEDTEQGVYTTTLNLGCGEVTLVLTIGDGDALNLLHVNSLALAPNPVSVGEKVRVLSSFNAADFADMTIEVYSSTGSLVYRQKPTTDPIVIDGLPTAGIYMVYLNANGKLYQAKLVVK